MFGHPSEHLIWAPDPRDDLAFTMFAMEQERHKDMIDTLNNYIMGGYMIKCDTFNEFISSICASNPEYSELTEGDWDKVLPYWKNM